MYGFDYILEWKRQAVTRDNKFDFSCHHPNRETFVQLLSNEFHNIPQPEKIFVSLEKDNDEDNDENTLTVTRFIQERISVPTFDFKMQLINMLEDKSICQYQQLSF